MIKHNDLVDLLVFPLDNVGKTSVLPYDHVKIIKDILGKHSVFPDYLHIQNIAYYNNKRGFVVTLADRTRHFVRPVIKKEINLIYLGRRLIGQPHCCAKAHAINAGLPGSFTNETKFKALEAVNLIPCRDCFEMSEHEYLYMVKNAQHPLLMGVATENINIIFATALLYLIQGDNNSYTDCEDLSEINQMFFIKSIESTIRGLNNVSAEGQRVLDKHQSATDAITISLLQQIENIVTSSIRIANDVSQKNIDELSLNSCYELAEVMAQLRSNLNNMNFALKYRGDTDGAF